MKKNCLSPCPACAHHVRANEMACPFCGEKLPSGFGECAKTTSGLARPLSRAALVFAGVAGVAAAASSCGGNEERSTFRDAGVPHDSGNDDDVNAVPLYGIPPNDAGLFDSGSDGSTDAASDAKADASADAKADANDSGPMPLYGAPPIDGGPGFPP